MLREAGFNELDGLTPYALPNYQVFRDADVIHCHALQGGWFSYPAVRLYARSKPIVLTLHDMWPFTGHCSFSFGCDRWKTGCGSCPHLDTYPAARRDATKTEWRLKNWTWQGCQPSVVCPSHWMARLAEESLISSGDITVIPHGIDLELFHPRRRHVGRQDLGIGSDTVAVLFAAASVKDGRKGGNQIARLVTEAALPPGNVRFLLMGGSDGSLAATIRGQGYDVLELGFISDDRRKAEIYAASDLFLFPTKADNSPLVILESLACGTPTLSYDIGGIIELVRPGSTGNVVEPGDEDAMSAALKQLVENPSTLLGLRSACRELATKNHNPRTAAMAHLDVYRRAIARYQKDR